MGSSAVCRALYPQGVKLLRCAQVSKKGMMFCPVLNTCPSWPGGPARPAGLCNPGASSLWSLLALPCLKFFQWNLTLALCSSQPWQLEGPDWTGRAHGLGRPRCWGGRAHVSGGGLFWNQHPYSVLLGEGFWGWSSYRHMGALVSAGALGLAREIGERWQGGLAEAGKNGHLCPNLSSAEGFARC